MPTIELYMQTAIADLDRKSEEATDIACQESSQTVRAFHLGMAIAYQEAAVLLSNITADEIVKSAFQMPRIPN